jgi:hypothetical protein
VLLTVTVQDSDAPEGPPRVHGDPVTVRPEVEVTATVPAGAVGEAPESVTVAVQVLSAPAATGDGEHEMSVDVGLLTATPAVPLLVVCALVGVYVPVTV